MDPSIKGPTPWRRAEEFISPPLKKEAGKSKGFVETTKKIFKNLSNLGSEKATHSDSISTRISLLKQEINLMKDTMRNKYVGENERRGIKDAVIEMKAICQALKRGGVDTEDVEEIEVEIDSLQEINDRALKKFDAKAVSQTERRAETGSVSESYGKEKEAVEVEFSSAEKAARKARLGKRRKRLERARSRQRKSAQIEIHLADAQARYSGPVDTARQQTHPESVLKFKPGARQAIEREVGTCGDSVLRDIVEKTTQFKASLSEFAASSLDPEFALEDFLSDKDANKLYSFAELSKNEALTGDELREMGREAIEIVKKGYAAKDPDFQIPKGVKASITSLEKQLNILPSDDDMYPYL